MRWKRERKGSGYVPNNGRGWFFDILLGVVLLIISGIIWRGLHDAQGGLIATIVAAFGIIALLLGIGILLRR